MENKKTLINKIDQKTFDTRLRTSIPIIAYLILLIIFAVLSDNKNIIHWSNNLSYLPFVFFCCFFVLASYLNYFIAREINICYLNIKSSWFNLILSLVFLIFQIGITFSYALFEYQIVSNISQKLIQIIFLSILFGGSLIIDLFVLTISRIKNKLNAKITWLLMLLVLLVNWTLIFSYYCLVTKTCVTIIALIAIAMFSDVFAYLGGSLFGKHKMCPNISPKKTWEGLFIGIFVTTLIILGLFGLMMISSYKYNFLASFLGWQAVNQTNANMVNGYINNGSWWGICIICIIIISIISTLGDLLFSHFKRTLKIKDFSNLLPGQGGVLDRIDSISLVLSSYFFISLIICIGVNGINDQTLIIQMINCY